jgi:predicted aldo/keto reductase-like oxidoreductase
VPSETGLSAQAPGAQNRAPQAAPKFTYGTLGKTGMKVTRVAFGCMVTSDQSVVERAADTGINYFDYNEQLDENISAMSQGLPVADVLRFLMYAESYGQFAMGREEFKALPAELAGVCCGSCGKCTVECPNGVQVAARLHKAQQLFA